MNGEETCYEAQQKPREREREREDQLPANGVEQDERRQGSGWCGGNLGIILCLVFSNGCVKAVLH